ncbi:hypothetical protein NP233_g4464 [Leucocoprinus birnbaumii]|uniref:G domain-containing protein n=1 Tax=Leucocoprinus birnbaumii TaxID=56174 RepID=A0AAD5VUM9_9AGAR|nr:hypothetical protein NP233_g4464 [Leucocoprinus birnbaumii]
MTDSTVIKAINNIRKDDIIIAFMGPTGCGKSYFIDLLTGQIGKRAGASLASVTSDIQATRVRHRKYGDRIVLVDTPGFDDTHRSDMEILTLINEWLERTYKNDVKLSGLIYLHRITDNRMAGSPLKNLRMFGNLCGDNAASRVILVSTMWEKVDQSIGQRREGQLKSEFWQGLIERGSSVDRLRNSSSVEAWRVVDSMISTTEQREVVLLQQEVVELERKLNETEAGKALHTSLQRLLYDQKETLKSLLAQVEKSDDPRLKVELEKEYKKIQSQFDKTFKEVNKMKIPIGRRLMLIFSFKKPSSKAIKIAESR